MPRGGATLPDAEREGEIVDCPEAATADGPVVPDGAFQPP